MRTRVFGFPVETIVQGAPIKPDAHIQCMRGSVHNTYTYTPKRATRWHTISTEQGTFGCGADEVLLTTNGWMRVRRLRQGDELVRANVVGRLWRDSQNIFAAQIDRRELQYPPWINTAVRNAPSFKIKKITISDRPRIELIRLSGQCDAVAAHGHVFRVGGEV